MKAYEIGRDINGNEYVTRVEFLTPADCAPPRREEYPQPDYPRKGSS